MVMGGITDEVLFYGGIVLAAFSFFALVIYILIFRTGTVRLDAQLDLEYGFQEKPEKNTDKRSPACQK